LSKWHAAQPGAANEKKRRVVGQFEMPIVPIDSEEASEEAAL
jgi:hypothetical protein